MNDNNYDNYEVVIIDKTSSICTQKEYLIMFSLTPYYKALQRKWDISLLFFTLYSSTNLASNLNPPFTNSNCK